MHPQDQLVTGKSTSDITESLKEVAEQYGFSDEAVATLWQSLIAGGGIMAQFRHPELGGTGQWTRGGMIMIGDMFNQPLKAKVKELCTRLASLFEQQPEVDADTYPGHDKTDRTDNWWGMELGAFSASGSQNESRYAYFPAKHRLAILDLEQVPIYDTGDHDITGVSQQQSASRDMTFTTQKGEIRLSEISPISEHDSTNIQVQSPSE